MVWARGGVLGTPLRMAPPCGGLSAGRVATEDGLLTVGWTNTGWKCQLQQAPFDKISVLLEVVALDLQVHSAIAPSPASCTFNNVQPVLPPTQ